MSSDEQSHGKPSNLFLQSFYKFAITFLHPARRIRLRLLKEV